jgi:phosphonate transport system ATP-binding protein
VLNSLYKPASIPILETKGVRVVYRGGRVALHPTDLSFRPGELTVLLGPSGAGKSSLLRTLNGLIQPSEGAVIHRGIGPLTTPAAIRSARRATGMVFQQHQLMRRQSALSNVLQGRLCRHSTVRTFWPLPRRDRVLALECLGRVGLFEKALSRVDQLSGGEQQRVGLARALAQEPSVILADEPVASLDPATARGLMEQLQAVVRNQNTLVVVSLHQVDLATEYGDRVIGLRAGTVVFDGPARKLDGEALQSIYGRRTVEGFAQPAVATSVF